jgi:hypothetical protein
VVVSSSEAEEKLKAFDEMMKAQPKENPLHESMKKHLREEEK